MTGRLYRHRFHWASERRFAWPVGRPPKKPVVWYHDFKYQAKTWDRSRRVVTKLEWHLPREPGGNNEKSFMG